MPKLILGLVLLVSLSGQADWNRPSCELLTSPFYLKQMKSLCELRCELGRKDEVWKKNQDPSSLSCERGRDAIKKKLTELNDLFELGRKCGSGVLKALVLSNLDLLAPAQLRYFYLNCEKNPDCRAELAQEIEQFRNQDKTTVSSKIEALTLSDLIQMSKHHQAKRREFCGMILKQVSDELRSEMARAEVEEQKKWIAKRQERFFMKAPECKNVLDFSDKGRSATGKKDAVAPAIEETVGDLTTYFNRVGTFLECHDSHTQTELMCALLTESAQNLALIGGLAKGLSRTLLARGPGFRVQKMKWYKKGENQSYIVELENGQKGVFKPCSQGVERCENEVLTFQFDRRLKLDLVPETVEKTILIEGKEVRGSFQTLIEDAKSPSLSNFRNPSLEQTERQGFLDFLILNEDRHAGNFLVGKQGKVYSIDHGRSFHVVEGPNFAGKRELAKDFLNRPEGQKVREEIRTWREEPTKAWLREYLEDPRAVDQAWKRIQEVQSGFDPLSSLRP